MKEIKNIIHIADIHIRPLDRHIEYKLIFEKLYKNLSELDKESTVLFICGDIFHTKDKILSETILIFHEFIKKLSNLVDKVFIILGNHDLYKSNDRYDTTYGIDTISQYQNVIFFRKSEKITYKNLNITANCINDTFIYFKDTIDTPNNNETQIEQKNAINTINIAMYHGIVHSDNSDFFGTKYKKLSDFDGYDLTLLGDIHQMKFLSKTVAYCGSLIQQNFAETREKGYIQYTLDSNKITSDFKVLSNDYSYVQFDITNNIEETIENIKKYNFSKFSHIKLILNILPIECTNDFINSIIYEIKNYTEILSITKQFKNIINKILEIKKIDDSEANLELNENKTINTLLNKLTNENKELMDNILEYHDTLKNEEKNNYNTNKFTNSWSISEIEFQNVFIYGENHINKINVSNGLIGIMGNNAIGKTCILNVIIYGLFGYISKNKNVNNRSILNKSSNSFYIQITINLNNVLYTIRRESGKQRKRKTGNTFEEILTFTSTIKESLDSDNQVKDLTCATKTDTEELIKETLGITNKDDFIFTNILSNSLNKNILTLTSAELDDIMGNLFNTKVYKNLFNIAKTELKKLKEEKISLETEINTFNNYIVSTNNIKNVNLKDKSKILKNQNLLEKKLKNIKKELEKYGKINCDFDEISIPMEISVLKNKINQYNLIHSEIPCKEYSEYELLKLKKEIESYDKSDFVFDEPENFDDSIDYNQKIETINNYIESHKLKENCISELTKFKSYKNFSNKIKKLSSFEKMTNEDFLITKEFFSNYMENCKNEVYNNNDSTLKKLNEKLESYYICKNYMEYVNFNKLNETYKSIKLYKEIEKTKKKLEEIILYSEYLNIKKEKEKIQNEIHETNNILEKILLIEEQQNITNIKIDELKLKLNELIKKLNCVSIYKDLMSDKYLPKYILDDTIKMLETEANEIIYSLCNLTISFETLENSKWNLIINKNNIELGVQQCSGFENFIINTALKVVFDKYKFYSGIKMFFIDESLDCVSEENFDKLDELFMLLKSYYKTVIVISHNETLKNKMEQNISISSNFISSKIN